MLALLLAFSSSTAPTPCKIENARYLFRADPSITALFHSVPRTEDWRNGVAMEMRFGKSGRTYWWLPYIGGTADNPGFRWTALKGTPEAQPGYAYRLGDLLYFPFDADYSMLGEDSAVSGHDAPAHFFLYNMRTAFWYLTDGNKREATARSLFDLAGCDASNAPQPDVVFPHVP